MYHGQIYFDEKNEEKDIRISFPVVTSSLYKVEHYKDEATNYICRSSCDKCSEKKSQIKYN